MKDKVTLTKAELADLMFEKVGLNKREAKDMVESFFEEIRIALEETQRFVEANPDALDEVVFVCFGQPAYDAYVRTAGELGIAIP